MDVHSKKTRSYNMSRIRGKDTKPEKFLRQWLWHNGYRYRLHKKNLPGKPDIVFPGRKKVIFVHGCFWHKHDCRYFKWPQTNKDFWKQKIEENFRRDQRNYSAIKAKGWKYYCVWECEIKELSIDTIGAKVTRFLNL